MFHPASFLGMFKTQDLCSYHQAFLDSVKENQHDKPSVSAGMRTYACSKFIHVSNLRFQTVRIPCEDSTSTNMNVSTYYLYTNSTHSALHKKPETLILYFETHLGKSASPRLAHGGFLCLKLGEVALLQHRPCENQRQS
jgi:hypothetical protein